MKIVGITGGIGSGKTTVCKVFETLGIPVYDADQRAKELYNESNTLRKKVIAEFGDKVYSEGKLVPQKLAEIVFGDEQKLEKLNSLVHPEVRKDFSEWLKTQVNVPFVLREAAILIESGSHKDCDKIIVVNAPEETRIERVMKRNKLSREDVQNRIDQQWKDEERNKYADFIIDNSGAKHLIPQVLEIYNKLK